MANKTNDELASVCGADKPLHNAAEAYDKECGEYADPADAEKMTPKPRGADPTATPFKLNG